MSRDTRAKADYFRRRKRELYRVVEFVVRRDVGQDFAKRTKLVSPLSGRPSSAIEVTYRVGSNLVTVAIEIVDVADTLSDVVGRATETDLRYAARPVRRLVKARVVIRDEIDAADEEGEVQRLAALVHAGGEFAQFLPPIELGAIVECHDDKLRRPLDRARRRAQGKAERRHPKEFSPEFSPHNTPAKSTPCDVQYRIGVYIT